ncbi:MAG: ABC transporter ATP-binding protein [Oscillospiraceae bacterium]|nr:ABC transporter ATP-binding protein [Oscillospiraceae bacterium]MDY2863574.1 ABC transporter ATP-binding protein [Oscillospiraceae bacterium]
MENILEIRGLEKKFPDSTFSIHDINLSLPKGAIMGLIGENGAGKTTLIRLILNIYGRSGGKITAFDGLDNVKDEAAFKEALGYVADEDFLYINATAAKTAKAFSYAFKEWDDSIFRKYMDMWQIDTKKRCGELSKGMKTKVMLALALAHKPKLLILDEPTAGLDPAARIEMLDILREFVSDGEHSVLFSTHITGDLDKVADYIALMIDGHVHEVMSADEAQEKYAVVSGDTNAMRPELLIGAKLSGNVYEALALRKDIPQLGDVTVRTPNFEDILVHTILRNRENRRKD